jgi:WD domain, G-beta repeat
MAIWERLSGQEILRLESFPKALAFSFDGKLLAGNDADSDPKGYDFWHKHMGSVYLWDTTTGERRQNFEHHAAEVRCIAFAPDGKAVASGSADHTVLIWDCSRAFADIKLNLHPLPKELDVWWDLLAAAKANEARKAMAQLVRCPAAATKLLGDRLKPAFAPNPEQLAAFLRDVSSPQFATRDIATKTLVQIGESALPVLKKAIGAAPDLETKLRLEHILSKATDIGFRKVRAVAVLEAIGDEGAMRVLELLAKGIPDSRQTIEAQAALRHLAK